MLENVFNYSNNLRNIKRKIYTTSQIAQVQYHAVLSQPINLEFPFDSVVIL